MHVAAVQFDIEWEDKPANHRRMEELIEAASLPPGTFVVLPELGDTGFSFDLDAIVDDRSLDWARGLARRRELWVQVGYAARGPHGRGVNCASIVTPEGKVAATYHKVHPFSHGGEARFFEGGRHLVVHPCPEAQVAPLICYDLRFPELWRHAALAGAELFTIGANWPETRQHHWRALLIARAIENQAAVVAVNRIGRDPHLAYRGGSMIITPDGTVQAEAGPEPAVLQSTIDLEGLRSWRVAFPALVDVRRELLGTIERNDR